jgi:hypothetical protein|nr:MAG: putative tail-component [Bacteriophage sp.]
MTNIPIDIDFTDLVSEFSLSDTEISRIESSIIDTVSSLYWERWTSLVNQGLHGTRPEYKKAMVQDRVAPNEIVFGLYADFPLMIEDGASPFDMKPGFRNSPKVKSKKIGSGWYIDIPFRHATSQAVAESGGFDSIMPASVYSAIRKESGPLTRNQLRKYNTIGSRKEINTPQLKVPEYIHKSPIYEGLVRVKASSTVTEKRSQYMTFRRVSDASDYTAWFHTGIVARKFMDKALDMVDVPSVVDKVVDVVLDRILNGE